MKKNTLHIFGGGVFVKHAVEIAIGSGWKVIVRTGSRFLNSLQGLDQYDIKIFCGDSLTELMQEGGLPVNNDMGISFSAPWIIPSKIIDLFNGRLYNLHNQPLPKFRGGGGASWNILMGHREGGCCIHLLTPAIDAGIIFAMKKFTYPVSYCSPSDFDKLVTEEAVKMIREWLPKLLENSDPGYPIENDNNNSEYWPRLNTDIHGWIDWKWRLNDIFAFCNAFSFPYSGAKTMINEKVINLLSVSIVIQKNWFHPFQVGIIYKIINNHLYVAHPDGTLVIEHYTIDDDNFKFRLGDRLFTPSERLEKALSVRIQYAPSGFLFELK